MSRIGKKEINIPIDTTISFEKNLIVVKGKYGIIELPILNGINISIENQKVFITRENNFKKTCAFHGLIRTLIYNMIIGVNEKFIKILLVEGVGYKFSIVENLLILNMGYSHLIKLCIPYEIDVKIDSPTKITLSGINKQKVGLFASKIRGIRPPEPYKGKGIRYENEIIRRKIGKTGK